MAAINGTVKMMSHDRHYGFIQGEDGRDYFFHQGDVDESIENMRKGDGVMFERGENARGPIALRVTTHPFVEAP